MTLHTAIQHTISPLTGTDDTRAVVDFIGEGRSSSKPTGRMRIERAIGVIYRPETERQSHYFQASVSSQFDAVLHFDHTSAVRPLEVTAQWTLREVPETYPTGV